MFSWLIATISLGPSFLTEIHKDWALDDLANLLLILHFWTSIICKCYILPTFEFVWESKATKREIFTMPLDRLPPTIGFSWCSSRALSFCQCNLHAVFKYVLLFPGLGSRLLWVYCCWKLWVWNSYLRVEMFVEVRLPISGSPQTSWKWDPRWEEEELYLWISFAGLGLNKNDKLVWQIIFGNWRGIRGV